MYTDKTMQIAIAGEKMVVSFIFAHTMEPSDVNLSVTCCYCKIFDISFRYCQIRSRMCLMHLTFFLLLWILSKHFPTNHISSDLFLNYRWNSYYKKQEVTVTQITFGMIEERIWTFIVPPTVFKIWVTAFRNFSKISQSSINK